jgi:lactoylglutathione lyase
MDVVHTALWVADLDRTRTFYEDRLDLEFSREFEGADGVVNYFVAGTSATELQFKYDPESDAAVDPAGIAHVAIEVDDLDATIDVVADESAGTITDGPMDADDARIAFGADPDGYGLEFIEPR